MAEKSTLEPESYAIRFSEAGRISRNKLPKSKAVSLALLEILEGLMINPDEYARSAEPLKPHKENRYVYKHPYPPIEITYQIDRKIRRITYEYFAYFWMHLKALFICYTSDDQKYWNGLIKYLGRLEREDKIKLWFDQRIGATDVMASAKAVLLLISPNLLSSPLGATDLPELIEGALKKKNPKILWFPISAIRAERDLPNIYAIKAIYEGDPLDQLDEARRNKAFLEISDKIFEVMES